MSELSEDAKYILEQLAKTRGGCVALLQLASAELNKVSGLIEEAIAKCEAAKNE